MGYDVNRGYVYIQIMGLQIYIDLAIVLNLYLQPISIFNYSNVLIAFSLLENFNITSSYYTW